jgi:hypothetical protein
MAASSSGQAGHLRGPDASDRPKTHDVSGPPRRVVPQIQKTVPGSEG